ncbi:MAG: hypothetical protein U0793_13735 [Gemmataceae bacterium]
MSCSRVWSVRLMSIALVAVAAFAVSQERRPVTVKFEDDKEVVVDAELPVDPVERIRFQPTGNFFVQINDEMGRTLHLSHFPTFKIDGSAGGGFMPMGGRFEVMNGALPKSATGKARKGYMNVMVDGDLRITQTVELTPTKSPGPGVKRQTDSVLIRYVIENKGAKPHTFGLRTYMDTYVIDNDACLFAAPNRPGKILDGVEFKGKEVPDYLQMLQRPDLKNPGYVAHLTMNLGGTVERPDRLVLTRHGAARDNWDVQVIGGGGDSAIAFFWEPKEIKPGAKREIVYAYGKGIASPVAAEGQFKINFSGSFEIGKAFSVAAVITDPAPGQTLELELPKGMEFLEGRHVQPVPEAVGESGYSMVLWKGRVTEYGRFPIRIKSSTGVTKTKMLTLAPG